VFQKIGATRSFRKHGLNALLGVPGHDCGVSSNVYLFGSVLALGFSLPATIAGRGALSTRFGFHLDVDRAGTS
jgi:hypothetical protein